jgi:hypothetical protein
LTFGHPVTGQSGMRKQQEVPITGAKIVIVMIQGNLQ